MACGYRYGDYVCSREANHTGNHRAQGTGWIFEWPQWSLRGEG